MYIILSSLLCQHLCFMGIRRDSSGVLFQECKMLKANTHVGIIDLYRVYYSVVMEPVVDIVRLGHSSAYKVVQFVQDPSNEVTCVHLHALLVDGHIIYSSLEAAELCRRNNNILFLGQCISAVMWQEFLQPTQNLMKEGWPWLPIPKPLKSITKRTFLKVFKVIWDNTGTVQNAISGSSNSGIFPFDHKRGDMLSLQDPNV